MYELSINRKAVVFPQIPLGYGGSGGIGGWGCESNREIIGFLCCEWVRETRCFLSLGRTAATCAPAPPASLVFPCVFSVNPVFVVFDQ